MKILFWDAFALENLITQVRPMPAYLFNWSNWNFGGNKTVFSLQFCSYICQVAL